MKIFVIDFAGTNEIVDLLNDAYEVRCEKKDGGAAYKQTGEWMPDLVVVNYKNKPSHGRLTAASIKARKKTAHIPIYFVDGTEQENSKITALGKSIILNRLVERIAKTIREV